MAYVSQERKKALVAAAKPILKKYGIRATFSVRHKSTIVCTVRSGKIDFVRNWCEMNRKDQSTLYRNSIPVNVYHYDDAFSGSALAFLKELIPALNTGNWDRSDPMSDYFNVGWYVDVRIGGDTEYEKI